MSVTSSILFAVVAMLGFPSALHAYNTGEHPDFIMHHSLLPPYISDWWEGGLAYWDFGGDAVITEDFIRLTPDNESRHGWLWNEHPIDLDSWHVHLGFNIHGKNKFGADGFALWYVERPSREAGPIFGMHNHFNGIGILFDTYDNNANRDTPAISLIQNDGNIRNFDAGNDYRSEAIARCPTTLRNQKGITIDVLYERPRLSVHISLKGKQQPYECFVAEIDLPSKFYFGLTSVTGQLSDSHDIEFFEFYPLSSAELDHNPYEMEGYEDYTEEEFVDPYHPQTHEAKSHEQNDLHTQRQQPNAQQRPQYQQQPNAQQPPQYQQQPNAQQPPQYQQ